MDGLRCDAAYAKDRREEIGSGTQMLDCAEKFHTVAFFGQRIIWRGDAFHRDLSCLQFKRLLGLGGEHQLTLHD